MSYSEIVLNRLLDKYEKSLHAQGQGLSKRRVLLSTDRGDIPEYDYHDVNIRDAFNGEVEALGKKGIVKSNWARKGYVLSEIWLNLESVDLAYLLVSRESKARICENYIQLLKQLKVQCSAAWIHNFADAQISETERRRRLSPLINRDIAEFMDVLSALRNYDGLNGESITMRAFSIKCYNNSKHFQQRVMDYFLVVAGKYYPPLIGNEEDLELDWREQLMLMGVFPMPELYELSGDIAIDFQSGYVDLSVFGAFGVALPDTLTNEIRGIRMEGIKRVILIENKTCYNEYVARYKQHDELVFYQGGFISQKKALFVQKLKQFAQDDTAFLFWGDIDIGGFRMYCQLKEYCEQILPWKMGACEVKRYNATGMGRPDAYFEKMEALTRDPCFIAFHAAIEECFHYRVTIEQESMLDSLMESV